MLVSICEVVGITPDIRSFFCLKLTFRSIYLQIPLDMKNSVMTTADSSLEKHVCFLPEAECIESRLLNITRNEWFELVSKATYYRMASIARLPQFHLVLKPRNSIQSKLKHRTLQILCRFSFKHVYRATLEECTNKSSVL